MQIRLGFQGTDGFASRIHCPPPEGRWLARRRPPALPAPRSRGRSPRARGPRPAPPRPARAGPALPRVVHPKGRAIRRPGEETVRFQGRRSHSQEPLRRRSQGLCRHLRVLTFPREATVHLALKLPQFIEIFIFSSPHIEECLVPCHIRENKRMFLKGPVRPRPGRGCRWGAAGLDPRPRDSAASH